MEFVGGAWWKLQLFDGWQAEEHPECIGITHSEGGAFQLSAAVKTHGSVTPAEVEAQSLQGTPAGARATPFSAGLFSGLSVGYDEGDVHWQRFWLAHQNVLVFATYNGTDEAWRSEKADVLNMLSTLSPRAPLNSLRA